jgi:HEAT repeat protein
MRSCGFWWDGVLLPWSKALANRGGGFPAAAIGPAPAHREQLLLFARPAGSGDQIGNRETNVQRALCLLLVVGCGMLPGPEAQAQTPDGKGSAFGVVPLGEVVRSSPLIFVLRVEKVDRKTGIITFSKTADLKGRYPAMQVRQQFRAGGDEREVLRSARPGQTAVCFVDEQLARVCVGNCWYAVIVGKDDPWRTVDVFEKFAEIYSGPTEVLARHIKSILAGREVTITARAPGRRRLHGLPWRDWVHGRKGPVWRIKASAKITSAEQADSPFSRHFVGWGVGDKESVPALVRSLKHPDERVRAEAAVDLGGLVPVARAAVPALRKALADADDHVRLYAADALLRIAPGNANEVGIVLRLLHHRDAELRRAAVSVLAEQPLTARLALPELAAVMLRDKDRNVRASAAHALGNIGPGSASPSKAIKALIQAVEKDSDAAVRARAIVALGRFGPEARPALPTIGAALADKESVAQAAVDALARFGTAAVPVLQRVLSRSGRALRIDVLHLVRDLGPRARPVAPVLGRLLRHEEPHLRLLIAEALLAIDPEKSGPNAVAVLLALASEKDAPAGIFTRAIHALGRFGGRAPCAVSALSKLLAHKDRRRRRRAAVVLSWLGPKARAAEGALEEALKDRSRDVRLEAASTLVRIGRPRMAVRVLLRALRGKNKVGRECWIFETLAEAGPAARAAAPLLRSFLREANRVERAGAALALWRVERRIVGDLIVLDPRQQGLDALLQMLGDPRPDDSWDYAVLALVEIAPEDERIVPALVPALVQALPYGDPWMKKLHAESLGALGARAWKAEPALRQALKDESPQVRLEAAMALARIKRGHPLTVPALLELAEQCPNQALAVMSALGKLKAEGRVAVPWLLRMLRHEDGAVALEAGRALAQIDPDAARKAGLP